MSFQKDWEEVRSLQNQAKGSSISSYKSLDNKMQGIVDKYGGWGSFLKLGWCNTKIYPAAIPNGKGSIKDKNTFSV